MEIVKKTRKPLVASLALLFAGTVAFGQASTTHSNANEMNHSGSAMSQSNSARMSTSDAQFAKQAAQANLAEVKLGQLAEQNGTNSTVKDFGKRMVNDHSNAEDKLKEAVEKDNITLPTTLSATDQATYDRLSKLSGERFDKAYAQDMVKNHTTDVAKFKHEANDGHNATIKNWASQTLPTLQEHLRLAKQMSQTVSASNSTTSTAKPTS